MTLDEFVTKYLGKYVEYHSYGTGALNQCVDLVNQYIVEVLGLPAIIGTNAQDFPSKAGSNYDYILNTPTGVPSKGDLVIFKSADNVGHISIFLEGNANLFTSLDQNYPTGSPVKKVSHNYRNVLGWLHPKNTNMTTYNGFDLSNIESMKTLVDFWIEWVKNGKLEALKSQVQTLTEQTNTQSIAFTSKNEEIAKLKQDLELANGIITQLKEAGVKQKLEIEALEKRLADNSNPVNTTPITLSEISVGQLLEAAFKKIWLKLRNTY